MADLLTWKSSYTYTQIEQALTFALTQVAVPFSTSSTYAVDDVVVYEGFLYQCITAVSVAGAWDSTKWQIQKIFDNDGYVIIQGGTA